MGLYSVLALLHCSDQFLTSSQFPSTLFFTEVLAPSGKPTSFGDRILCLGCLIWGEDFPFFFTVCNQFWNPAKV